MSVSLEKIDMLMERANISYKEAKEALEMHNGDMVESLIYLEASNKTAYKSSPKPQPQRKTNSKSNSGTNRNDSDFFEDVRKFIKKMHKTNFVIGDKNKKIIDIPLTIAALIILFTLPVSIFILIVPYLFGYKISILDTQGNPVNFQKTFSFGSDDSVKTETTKASEETERTEEDRLR